MEPLARSSQGAAVDSPNFYGHFYAQAPNGYSANGAAGEPLESPSKSAATMATGGSVLQLKREAAQVSGGCAWHRHQMSPSRGQYN